MTFISRHSIIIYVVFFGACMRCTRLCSLKPGCDMHHTIASFHIALHHTSYHINSKRSSTKQPFDNSLMNKSVPGHEVNLRQFLSPIISHNSFAIEGLFSLRSMKRRKVFFRRRLKNGKYTNFMHRKEIY
jgi:hypothetical protein